MRTTCLAILTLVSSFACAEGARINAGGSPTKIEALSVECGLNDDKPCARLSPVLTSDHLTLRPVKDGIGIVEAMNADEMVTQNEVVLGQVANKCPNGGSTYFGDKATMSIVNTGDFTYRMDVTDRVSDVNGPFSGFRVAMHGEFVDFHGNPNLQQTGVNTSAKAQWLKGSVKLKGVDVTAYVFLLDEKSGAGSPGQVVADIWKHYLVEMYDVTCGSDEQPSVTTIVQGAGKALNDARTTPKQPKQPTTGNGWEPHHP